LEALFGTQLTSGEIVTGKFLGRLGVLIRILCLPLPLIVVPSLLGELSFLRVLIALLVLTGVCFFLSAACMLSAVWTRRTSDAILACYAVISLAFLCYQAFVSSTRLGWLNPMVFLHEAFAVRDAVQPTRFILHMASLTIMGGVWLALAAHWLRLAS